MSPDRRVMMFAVDSPPKLLDGARVVHVASLSRAQPTGRTRHVVDGYEVSTFAAVAVAQYEGTGRAYLFYCDHEWNVVTDSEHESVKAAIEQANFEFGLLPFREV